MPITCCRAASSLLLVLCCASAPRLARAQQAAARHVEFFPGPIVSSNRIVSMGGAYTGIAAGADAHLINPAAFARRPMGTQQDWFGGDWALSWLDEAPASEEASAQESLSSFQIDAGFDLKFGRFGIGLHAYGQSYQLVRGPQDTQEIIDVSATYGGLGLGWSAWRDQLALGVVLGTAELSLSEQGAQRQRWGYDSEGFGVLFGAHYAPDKKAWQLGARARREISGAELAIEGEDEATHEVGTVLIPWQVALGGAWRVRWSERLAHPMLLSSDLVLTGKSSHPATTPQAFVRGEAQARTGEQTTLAPHVGGELEVLDDRLRVRAGSYWEPDRALDAVGRAHLTLGSEVRLHLIWDWRVDACLDWAPGYFNWGVGLGFWSAAPEGLVASELGDERP